MGGCDPSGPTLTPDGIWHVFPISGNWGHCTSPDLLHWNCSHPHTGWPLSNTGGLTVTPSGYFIAQANNWNISMAKVSLRQLACGYRSGGLLSVICYA
jgi:hypothetical protein